MPDDWYAASGPPPAEIAEPWTDEQLAEFQRRFEAANTPAAFAAHMRREMRRLLPRRVRAWLWWRKRERAAIALLRLARLRSG